MPKPHSKLHFSFIFIFLSVFLLPVGTLYADDVPTVSFSASPASISPGQSSTLYFSVSGSPTDVTISPPGSSVLGQASVTVSPPVTTTYTLVAISPAGNVQSRVTVVVASGSAATPISTVPPSSAFSFSPPLFRTLHTGMSGSDVSQLQTFLFRQSYLKSDSITGYFGNLTKAAVKYYQCAKMIICSGNEYSTGWGQVGKMTRTLLNASN